MIEAVIEFSIRRRWLVIFASLVLAAWGWWAAAHTPIDAIPDLSENQVIVFTDWPGRTPAEIERQITFPLSLQLQGLDDVRVVRTSSDFGFSMIHVIFEDRADLLAARRQIGERLAAAAAKLPPGVQPYLAPESPATGQIFWYTVEGAGRDLGELRTLHDTLVKPQLAATSGVAEVASVGGYTTELQVLVDPLRLEASGVTLGQLSQEIAAANLSLAGHAVQTPTAEYLIEAKALVGRAGESGDSGGFDYQQAARDLETVLIPLPSGGTAKLGELASVSPAPGFRRGVLEKDGSEVVGGVVMMRYGENPLEVTRRLYEKITQLQRGLPSGVSIVPGYDRTPLIRGAVGTVSGIVVEAMIVAAVCVLLVLLHWRSSLVVVITLPFAALGAFALMWLLGAIRAADVQTNIMSLAGLAISIGVLVDSSIVIAENVMHNLHQRFGAEPVRGDTRAIVAAACRTVGRPIFFSVLILLLSFLPVLGLGGIEGKMFFPLACTKSFAVAIAAVLSITLAPALCTVLIRGRLRSERDSWIVRSFMDVYRPLLNWLIDRPAAAIFLLGATLLVGFAASPWKLLLPLTACALVLAVAATARGREFWLLSGGLLAIAFSADQAIEPLQSEFMTPLDEGVVMDMPITIPRASVSQSADDLKARDMMLCRFPEVEMVMGKAGRAETAADPAPIDMIETMVSFRPREFWPKRSLRASDARGLAEQVWRSMVERNLAAPVGDAEDRLIADSLTHILPRFDALLREYAYQRNREHTRALEPVLLRRAVEESAAILRERANLPAASDTELAALAAGLPRDAGRRLAEAPTEAAAAAIFDAVAQATARRYGAFDFRGASWRENAGNLLRTLGGSSPATPSGRVLQAVQSAARRAWKDHVAQLNDELIGRAAETFARLALEDLLLRGDANDPQLANAIRRLQQLRESPPRSRRRTHHGGAVAELPELEPTPAITALQAELTEQLARRVMLWRKERSELVGFGGEMDLAVQMPGWTNVWTMPIQNRVDMLSTGVNTTLGIRVLGNNHQRVVSASEEIARAVSTMAGAAQVVADPVRGKGYLTIDFDRERAAQLGVRLADAGMVVQAALGGLPAATIPAGREPAVVRIRFPAEYRDDLERFRRLPVPAIGTGDSAPSHASLEDVARAEITDGPASIKGDNGLLRNYVRLNVTGRDARNFIEEAQQRIAELALPEGVHWEWTGQFQHQERARRTLIPVVLLVGVLILALLYATYRDLADALLVLSAVPGAVAGGMFMQWCFGFKFSVTVAVGYIACFGMAAATGVIMLVYLREALAKAGGLERVTLPQLREAVLTGAVHRLRPKLLTEATTILSLAPLLWADGVGAEVIRPMIAPVLGGILVADEAIDLFLPVMFYRVRERRWRKLHGEPAPASDSPAAAPSFAAPEYASAGCAFPG